MARLKVVRNKHNTPSIIKYPFWHLTLQGRQAVYACVNTGQALAPQALGRRAICVDGDIGAVLRDLRAHDRPQKAAPKARPEKGPFHGIEAADGNA